MANVAPQFPHEDGMSRRDTRPCSEAERSNFQRIPECNAIGRLAS